MLCGTQKERPFLSASGNHGRYLGRQLVQADWHWDAGQLQTLTLQGQGSLLTGVLAQAPLKTGRGSEVSRSGTVAMVPSAAPRFSARAEGPVLQPEEAADDRPVLSLSPSAQT